MDDDSDLSSMQQTLGTDPSSMGSSAGGGAPGSDIDMQKLATVLGSISADPEKTAALQHQMSVVQQMRQSSTSMPQGHMAGRVYVAPNALQDASAAIGGVMQAKQGTDTSKAMMTMANQQQQARTMMMQRALADHINGQQGNPSQASNGQMPAQSAMSGMGGSPGIGVMQQPPQPMDPNLIGGSLTGG